MTHNFRSLRTSINSGIHERWASIAKETESFTKGFKRVFVNSVQSLYIGAKGRFMQFEGHKGRPSNAGSTPYSNLITITTRPQSLPVFVDRVFDLIMPMWEPPVPDGKKRVKWTCRCGTPLFDDFTELKPRAIENLEAELRGLGRTSGSGALKQLGELVVAAFKTWIVLPFVQKNYQNPWPASILLPTHTTNAQTASAIHQTGNNLYLLLCVDRGEFETKLHQKIINGLSNDRGIFQSLLREYHDYRKFRTWFTLRGISQLSLTRFTVDLGSFTEVHKHIDTCNPSCVCLPPEPKIDIEYRCRPAPKTDLGYVPAIGPARLTHYFRNPDCARNTQTTIYAQLPKRICGELLASDVTEELGWGIHFQEGWHWRTIFVIVIGFLFSFSLAFGIAWSVSKSDIRGAFAISGFVIASGSMLLGCLALRS
ncbi:hypothetical protein F4777DRAFT_134604 [Nemania sp. FL0916]|nr:hypothetical protein F4777DRAFT_134604 [Nemania sp. FL0916]